MPVSGSGDVVTIEDAFTRWRETNCDGVLIGRGAMANPWIFRQIEDTLNGRPPFEPTLEDKREILLEYFDLLRADMPELPAIGRMKQLAGQFTRGLQGGVALPAGHLSFALGQRNPRPHRRILRDRRRRTNLSRRRDRSDRRDGRSRARFVRSRDGLSEPVVQITEGRSQEQVSDSGLPAFGR